MRITIKIGISIEKNLLSMLFVGCTSNRITKSYKVYPFPIQIWPSEWYTKCVCNGYNFARNVLNMYIFLSEYDLGWL